MKTIRALTVAAAVLAISGGAQAAERTATHRHGFAKGHAQVVHRHAASRTYARCDCRRDRVARADAPVRGPFHVEEIDDGRAYPTATNNYWFQSSIFDFQQGKRANLKEYRY